MKKSTFVFAILSFCFLSDNSFSQDTKTIKVKFDKVKIGKLDSYTVPKGEAMKIEVEGINTALHKIVYKFEDFYWFTEKPESLKSVFPGAISIVPGAKLLDSDVDPLTKRIDLYSDAINSFKDSITVLYKKNLINNDNIKAFADTVIAGLRDSVIKTGLTKTKKKDVLTVLENDILFFIAYYESLVEMSKSTAAYDTELASMIGKYRPMYENLKKNQSSYMAGIKNIVSLSKKAPTGIDSSKVYTPTKEVTTVKIYILDKFDPTDTVSKYEADVYRVCQFKLDFSTGVGINSLVKPQYYIGNTDGTPFIANEKTRDLDYSIMALLQTNWRLSQSFSMGLATGVSVSAYDANTGYVLGLGTSFGKRNSVSLSTGAIIGKTIALSKKVSSDGKTADLPLASDISAVPTYDKVGYGWFISFTYNLSRTKKTD